MNDRSSVYSPWRRLWTLPDSVTYLNHGSFGPSPRSVLESFRNWSAELERQPMDFFLRRMEPALDRTVESLASFIGASRGNLVLTDNATFGMNIVAASVQLKPDDEVLLTDHEYGAVTRLWRRICRQSDARVVTATLPDPLVDPDEIVDAIMDSVSAKTRLIVMSHVTSPTAATLPVAEVCRRARERNVAVCVDGPHAVAMQPLNLQKMECDFYTASCHKWLSAPFGSGFLFVHPRQQKHVSPALVSWGGSIGGRQPSWKDEFVWLGTRNPAALLAVRDAIRFFESDASAIGVGVESTSLSVLDTFRSQSAALTAYAEKRIVEQTGLQPLCRTAQTQSPSMVCLPLPASPVEVKPGERDPLQDELWERFEIEIPIIHWKGQRFVRVSTHLYNSEQDIDLLVNALSELLPKFS